MKAIGLLGGMSWESTLSYYQAINQGIQRELGGLHSAKIWLHSVDFAEIASLQRAEDWVTSAKLLSAAAISLQNSGAECLLICTNTMHIVAAEVASAVTIPLIHIADATAIQLQNDGHKKVALLGTRFTMEKRFYKDRLREQFNIDVLIPELSQREQIHDIIYQELCQGIIRTESRAVFLAIVETLTTQGAEAIILGCTEIGLLIRASDTDVPLYDTAQIHAQAAVAFALS